VEYADPVRTRRFVRVRIAGCLLGGVLVAFQLGPTTTGRAVDQINGMSSRPLPPVGANPVAPSRSVWVPGQYVRLPGEPTPALVPGHWELRLPGGTLSVPPVTVERPTDGSYQTLPGTTRQSP
jgi:hypothetical protein